MKEAFPLLELGKVLRQRMCDVQVDPFGTYQFAGVRSFGGGVFRSSTKNGSEFSYRILTRIRQGDFVYPKLMAWEGALGIVPPECSDLVVSPEFCVFEIDATIVEPRWLDLYFKQPVVWPALAGGSAGTNVRRRRIYPQDFLRFRVPVPPLKVQRDSLIEVEAVLDELARFEAAKAASTEALENLVPAALDEELARVSFDGVLGDVLVEKPRNGWSPVCDNSNGGIAVLALGAVTGFAYRRTEIKHTSQPTTPGAHYWLTAGDLLMTRGNTPSLVGHAAIYDGTPSPCIYPDLMMRLRVDPTKATTRFVHWVLQCRRVRDFLVNNASGTSPTMKKISQGTVMSVPFPTRISLDEQQLISRKLDDLSAQRDRCLQVGDQARAAMLQLRTRFLGRTFRLTEDARAERKQPVVGSGAASR